MADALKVALVFNEYGAIPDRVADQLCGHGIVLVHRDCADADDVVALAGDADVVWDFSGSRAITAECLTRLSRCRVILRTGVGTDNIPVQEATALGIVVANTPEAIAETVAEHAMGLILAAAHRLVVYERAVRGGRWEKGTPKRHLSGRVLGLVGFGRIGRIVARMAGGFRMKVLASDPVVEAETMVAQGVEKADLETLLSRSDFISVHTPLLESTRHLVGESQLKMMRPHAVLVNTSRGPVVDEAALIRALREGWIGGAGLDVLEVEPPASDNPLMSMPNVALTPHVASYDDEFWDKLWSDSVRMLVDVAEGRMPKWYVNREVVPRRPPEDQIS